MTSSTTLVLALGAVWVLVAGAFRLLAASAVARVSERSISACLVAEWWSYETTAPVVRFWRRGFVFWAFGFPVVAAPVVLFFRG